MGKTVQNSFKRIEKKYLLTWEQYEAFLEGMQDYMVADVYGQTTNCSLYYDTEDWELIRRSIEKPVYKEKLRIRSYGTPSSRDQIFIELKKKFKGVVYKRRITMEAEKAAPYLAGDRSLSPGSQIGNEIEYFQQLYHAFPRVMIAYDRCSFAGAEDESLRITFDQNIRFRDCALDLRLGDWGAQMLPDDRVLMEIKIPEAAPLWLVNLLSAIGARPASFSKYGFFYKNYVMGNNRKEMPYSA